VEDNWGLGSLGTTDHRATSIGNVFDFTQNPRKFKSIRSRYSARYFESEAEPPQHGDSE
jgi:hypothetical protein